MNNTENVADASSNISINEPIVNTTTQPSQSQLNIVMNLAELLLSNTNEPSYKLSSTQINWITQFINSSPESFTVITNDIKNITSTGSIGLHNIPQIIHLCADIYSSNAIKNGLSNPTNIITFIKFTLDVILTSKYLILPDIEKELLQSLVDASLNLLIMNLGSIEDDIAYCETNKCCISFLNLFKCCK
jgi:hypothetical protein